MSDILIKAAQQGIFEKAVVQTPEGAVSVVRVRDEVREAAREKEQIAKGSEGVEKAVRGFCVKCKKKVHLTEAEERENADARKHVGKCPECGTEVHKFAEKSGPE